MITTPTVLILGAGASMPYGFPSGEHLRNMICGMDVTRFDKWGIDKKDASAFLTELKMSAFASVDAFLEHRPEFMHVGKLATAFWLVSQENPDHVFPGKDWYQYLLPRIDAELHRFSENKLSIITFNYDRSLEYFLQSALCHRHHRNTEEEVSKALSAIKFVHVHGHLGKLPWQSGTKDDARDFKVDLSHENLSIAANGIKIISEDMENSDEFKAARQLMDNAKLIIFLGFGYHPVNMKRLAVPFGKGKETYGTALGFYDPETRELQKQYPGLMLSAMNCIDHLRHNVAFTMAQAT